MRFEPVKFGLLVDEMPRAQVGTVMKLILRLWEFGPMSEAAVRTVANGDFEVVRSRMCEVEGLLSFEMVEDARDHGKRRVSQRVEAGKASAAKRNDKSTTVERTMNDRSTDVLSMSNSLSLSSSESQNSEKGTRAKVEKDPHFESLWTAYERYGAKAKAYAYWQKLTLEDRTAIIAKAPDYVKSTPGCEYRKQLEGWINPDNRLWERPIVQRKGFAMQVALHSADVPPDAYSER